MTQASRAVHDLFVPIADTYRAANATLTLGLDGYWRRQAVRCVLRGRPAEVLDLCTGTGEMAERLHRAARGRLRVVAADFCEPMLREARRRLAPASVVCVQADASRLPFPEASFDAVTIGFALRNLHVTREHFLACMRECRRVLRAGGRLVTVETTQPPGALMRRVLHAYTAAVVPWVGTRLSGSRPAYTYLSGTIRRFCGAAELAQVLGEAGFAPVRYRRLTCGLVAVHEAVKGPGPPPADARPAGEEGE